MTNDDFIDLLESRQLVPANVVRQLRAKAAQGDSRVTPKSILKYLVKKDLVSRSIAKDLLETTLTVNARTESSILGLIPLPDTESPASKPAKAPKAQPVMAQSAEPAARVEKDAPVELEPIEEDGVVDLSPVSLLDEAESLAAVEQVDPLGDAPKPLLTEPAQPKVRGLKTSSAKTAKKIKKPVKKEKGKSEWESPLLLIGGGGLAVLVLSSVVLWWLVFREGADAALAKANDARKQGQYSVAIENYKAFLDNYPRHKDFSQAKVQMNLAQLWELAESRNYGGAADKAPDIISNIENEPAFIADPEKPQEPSEAKKDLSDLLTNIAKGLAEQAESAKNDEVAQERIKQINTVLELASNTKYIPPALRRDAELDDVRQTLQRVQTKQKREADLAAALAKMDEAVKGGKPAAALAVRADLLKIYPVLIDDNALSAKLVEASNAEQAAIKFAPGKKAALTEAAQTPVVAELALADRRGPAAAGAAAAPVTVQIEGAVYGLNTADGALLWRHFVGLGGNATPLMLPNGNVIAADSQHGELVALNAQTGKLAWRQPLEGKLATPVAAGDKLLVASDAGKLFVLNQASGELLGQVPFSQPLRVPPAVNEQGDRIYVLGEHSNVYTLSGADFSCLGVYYLGQAPGSVVAPPVVVVNKLIVAINSGTESSNLRALSLNERGIVTGELSRHRLAGLVMTPIATAGRRFAVVTSVGQVMVFEAGPSNDKASVALLATRDATAKEPIAEYALLHEGQLWIAGHQLLKLAILPTGNQLPVQSIDKTFQGDAFDYPLQSAGNLLIHVRRPAAQAGAIVAAMDAAANRSLWEIALAEPPAGAPAIDATAMRMTAGSASGDVFQLDREAMTRRVQDQAKHLDPAPPHLPPLTDSLDLGQGRLVLSGVGGRQIVHFRPGDPRQELKLVDLPGALTCAPVAWRDGFVTATEVGQVGLHRADDASPAVTAFQPELTPGRKFQWLRPAVVGADGAQLAVSDGVSKVYLLSNEPQPEPHLKAAAAADVGPTPLETQLAVVGSRLCAGNNKGQLASFTLPALTPNAPFDLGGRVVWGPYAIGNGLLLATDHKELLLVGADGAIRWRRAMKRGQPTGTPRADAAAVFVLYQSGGVARLNLADRADAALIESAEPAVAGPVAFGQRLVISAHDGTLLVVNRP
jgi:hypothetical protein